MSHDRVPTMADGLRDYTEDFPHWWVYRGTGRPATVGQWDARWPKTPSARRSRGTTALEAPVFDSDEAERRLGCASLPGFRDPDLLNRVNIAIALARPLLVTGDHGVGKSALAYAIARELGLGRVLRWSLTPTDSMRSGLYEYDAVARVHATRTGERRPTGDFLRLGSVGTAFLPYQRPRVLLLDGIDQADFEFPLHLMTLLEDGQFEIPELVRDGQPDAVVFTADPGVRAPVSGGLVRCDAFPLVIATSGGDREFPPAFLRRCVEVRLREQTVEELRIIIDAHFPEQQHPFVDELVHLFVEHRAQHGSTDVEQLLGAVHLFCVNEDMAVDTARRDQVLQVLWSDHLDGR